MNREAPVRACPSGDPKVYNFEIKSIDGTSNPYLALSAILAAGMIGVKSSTPLKIKACQGTKLRFLLMKMNLTNCLNLFDNQWESQRLYPER